MARNGPVLRLQEAIWLHMFSNPSSPQTGDLSAAPMIPSPKEPKEGSSLNPYMVSGIVGVGLRTVDVVVVSSATAAATVTTINGT